MGKRLPFIKPCIFCDACIGGREQCIYIEGGYVYSHSNDICSILCCNT